MDQAVGTDTMAFRLADPDRTLTGVRLVAHVGIPGDRLDFGYDSGEWRLVLPRPPVWRLEYKLELRHPDGGTEEICDPGNPRRVGGAFGDKSVLEFPDYSPPKWLDAHPPRGAKSPVALPSRGLAHDVPAIVWSAHGSDDEAELPLLVVHDGPEYDAL